MQEQKKIALFVDFDNIYLGLRETSREAAEAFATRPATWLKWIEHGMPLDPNADRGVPKENRVLIRRCYLNPDTFGKYRGYFTRSGFSVVDCPPLTSRGKNSSDIVMVMDILDALRHETHFDRFVIMSADADFTPVLQRLRAHDRRTAVLVSGQAAPAYRAACDRLITEDQFIDLALEIAPAPEPQRAPSAPAPAPSAASASAAASASGSAPASAAIRDPELLAAIGQRIYEEASSTGTLSASELPRILREFKEFTPTSNWLGYYSLQSLAEAVLAHRPELRITDDDPWRIAVQVADEPAAPPAAADAGRTPPPAGDAEWAGIRGRVVERVARLVAESAEPVVMGKAAHAAIQEAGPMITETRWLGKGTFKNLLLSAPDLPFKVVAFPLPGFLFDPARHAAPSERAAVDGLADLDGEMASLIRRIHQLTDAPKLTPRQYRVLFQVIAKEITRAPYSLMSTGKAVRDQCVERGEPIARQSITLVLRGLGYGGYRFWEPPHRAENLAYTYRGNLINLLRQAQVVLSEDELRMLDDWLMGPIAEEPSTPADAPPSVPADASLAPVDAVDASSAPASEADAPFAIPADAADGSSAPVADAGHPTPADPVTVPAMDDSPLDPAASRNASPPADPADTAEPVEAVEPDFATADALPAQESHGAEPAEDRPVSADWQPAAADAPGAADAVEAVESIAPVAGDSAPTEGAPHPADATTTADAQPSDTPPPVAEQPVEPVADADPDAIPVELSEDHGPAGPDIVAGEWEMSDEPAPAEPTPESAAPAAPAEPPAPAEPARDEVVTAEWQPADAAESSASAPDVAAPPAPTEPPAPDEPARDEVVTAEWQPADAAESSARAPEAAAPPAPAEPSAAAEPPRDEVVTAEWQPADAAESSAPAPEAAAPPAPIEPPAAAAPAHGEIVVAEWQPADAPPAAEAHPSAGDAPAPEPAREPVPEPRPASGEVYTPFWEAEDQAAPEPPPAETPAPVAAQPPETPPGDAVTPQWEAVGQPEAVGDAAAPDAQPREDQPSQQSLWWQ